MNPAQLLLPAGVIQGCNACTSLHTFHAIYEYRESGRSSDHLTDTALVLAMGPTLGRAGLAVALIAALLALASAEKPIYHVSLSRATPSSSGGVSSLWGSSGHRYKQSNEEGVVPLLNYLDAQARIVTFS